MGFPGEEEADAAVTIGGTFESCLLEDVDERSRMSDEDIESDKTALESFMR